MPSEPPATDAPAPGDAPTLAPAPAASRAWAVAGVLLSLATIGALFGVYTVQKRLSLAHAFDGLDWRWVAAAVLLHVGAHLCWSLRMAALANGLAMPLSPRTTFRLVTAGVFGAAVTPGRVGGDGLRFALMRRRGWDGSHVGSLLVADRALDILFFLAAGLVGIAFLPSQLGAHGAALQAMLWAGLAAQALLVAALAVLLASPGTLRRAFAGPARLLHRLAPKRGAAFTAAAGRIVQQAHRGLRVLLRERRGWAAAAAVMTCSYWVCEMSIPWVVLRGFGFHAPYGAAFLAAIVVNILASLPLTPGGSGVAELAALALLTPLVPRITPAFLLLWRAITFYYDLGVGGLVASRGASGLQGPPAPQA